MEFLTIFVPATLALASLAMIGYQLGRRIARRSNPTVSHPTADELQCAESVIRELQAISQKVRRDLAAHHASVLKFRERLNELSEHQEEDAWREMSAEAQRVLQPTQHLSTQIGHAYDKIRQQTQTLMSFARPRAHLPRPRKRRAAERLRICIANDRRHARSTARPHVVQHVSRVRQTRNEQGGTVGSAK